MSKKRQHRARNPYTKGWVGVTDNSDDIYETMTLSSHQMLRSECVMVIKALHIPRNGELFSKEEQ